MIGKYFITVSSLAAVCLLSSTAYADGHETGKFYVTGFVGIDQQGDQALRGANAAGAPRNIDIELSSGEAFGLALGVVAADKEWGRLRFEAELAYREGNLSNLDLNNVTRRVRPGSDESITTGFINAVYDTPVLADRFRLFGGAGFGIANVDHQVRYLVERPVSAGGNLAIAIPSTETSWAYQLIGGVEYMLSDNLSVIGDFRYVDVEDFQVERFVLTTGALDSILDGDKSTVSYSLGIRYSF